MLVDGIYVCDECLRRSEDGEDIAIQRAVYYVPAEGDDLALIDVCAEHYLSTYGEDYPKENVVL